MSLRAIAVALTIGLTGCAPLAGVTKPESATSTTRLDLYQAQLNLNLALARSVQVLPTTWDQATVSIESAALRSPVSSTYATSSATIPLSLQLPVGPATVSVWLSNVGILVGTGSTTVDLVPGPNSATITLDTQLDFSGGVKAH